MSALKSLEALMKADAEPWVAHWFRRDLRLEDNKALDAALRSGHKVVCFFLFDPEILDGLEDRDDARVTFIRDRLVEIDRLLRERASRLLAFYIKPLNFFEVLSRSESFAGLYANRDYEPYALQRDQAVFELLKQGGKAFKGFKDQVIFEKSEVVKADGAPYTVFTPYMKRWKQLFRAEQLATVDSSGFDAAWMPVVEAAIPTLEEMGFRRSNLEFPPSKISPDRISNYEQQRDIPSVLGTSRLSLHLRFGTISIRSVVAAALKYSEKWLNELIWREFYMMILYHFPHSVSRSFKPAYDRIAWEDPSSNFEAWCQGRTGYPLVDAGMRELNETGFMHNRVRMVAASFLTKHLLIDWRLGERYFARKLLDFELSSNVGGWQWAASSGCDAAPYFRVFNPELQMQRFDPQNRYILKWVPELHTPSYPKPIVDHRFARERVLLRFKEALGTSA